MPLILAIVGGLAFFLLGLELLSGAVARLAGQGMRRLLTGCTRWSVTAAATGAGVTAVLQSSVVTSILVIHLIDARVIALAGGLAVIVGAKIGSTVTGQLLAFPIGAYALFIIGAGVLLRYLGRRGHGEDVGRFVLGLGLIFHGIATMTTAVADPAGRALVEPILQALADPWLAAGAGLLATLVLQTASGPVGIAMALAAAGVMAPAPAIALVLGANLGATAATVWACLGRSRAAQRAAVFTVGFVLAGVVPTLLFFNPFVALAQSLSPAGDAARLVANAQTLFCVLNAVLILPFVAPIARALQQVLPDGPSVPVPSAQAHFLAVSDLTVPAAALANVERELAHWAAEIQTVVLAAPAAIHGDDQAGRDAAVAADVAGDQRQTAILDYLRRLAAGGAGHGDAARISTLMSAANAIETASDLLARYANELVRQRDELGLQCSAPTRHALDALAARAASAWHDAAAALAGDRAAATRLNAAKTPLHAELAAFERHLATRLAADAPERLATIRFESDLAALWRQLAGLARKAARAAPC